MILCDWESLPENIKTEAVRPYYEKLSHKRFALACKRAFDLIAAVLMLIILSPLFLVIAIIIKLDSKGPVFYRQIRVTQYGRMFKIHKFRTMVSGADKSGVQLTVDGDSRVTKVGKVLRGCRLDELPQLIDVIAGKMSFVGTRPEVPKYVAAYSDEMMATLLLPAGITSEASIRYKDEAKILEAAVDVDRVYIERVMPDKMKYNLADIMNFSFFGEIATMFRTVLAVLGKDY